MRPRWAGRLRRGSQGLGIALGALIGGTVIFEYAAGWRSGQQQQALVSEGRTLYAQHCALCHGARLEGTAFGSGLAPPPLKKPGFAFWFYVMPRDMEGFVADLIGTGRGQMPPWGGLLSAGQRRSLAAFIHGANTGSVPLP